MSTNLVQYNSKLKGTMDLVKLMVFLEKFQEYKVNLSLPDNQKSENNAIESIKTYLDQDCSDSKYIMNVDLKQETKILNVNLILIPESA